MSPRPGIDGRGACLGILRTVYLRRLTGLITFEGHDRRLYFQDGELCLGPEHPAAGAVEQRLQSLAPAALVGDKGLLDLLLEVVLEATRSGGEARFDGGTDGFPNRVVGPLPTISVLLEMSVRDLDETELLSRLGGEKAKLQNSPQSPAMQQLSGLEQGMLQLMANLESPTPIGQLLRLHGNRLDTLRSASRLWAVGLAKGDEDGAAAPGAGHAGRRRQRRVRRAAGDEGKVLSARALELFSERIADDLERFPLELPPEEHRRRVAGWMERHAALQFYELLGVDTRVEDAALHEAFRAMGRLVHPIHAARLGLTGRDEGLKVLFEKVTEAYLVLSDPRRRASYNLLQGISMVEEVDEAKRTEERRKMATSCYHNALHALAEHVQDYGQAVTLLKEATRLDPQASYFSLLGQALAKNPRWRDKAVEAFRQAVELDPKNAGIHVAFAELLEKCGDVSGARQHFTAALDDMPNHPTALRALDRLGGPARPAGEKLGGLRRIFGSKG